MIFFVASVGLYLGRYVQTIHPEHSYYKEMVMKTDKVLFLYVFVHSFGLDRAQNTIAVYF